MTKDDTATWIVTSAVLQYGHAPRRFWRVRRLIPRPSLLTIVMLVSTAMALCWFDKDYHSWVLRQSFNNGLSPLSETVSPDGKRIVVLARDYDTSFVPFGPLQMRSVASTQTLYTFGKADDVTRALHFSPDGSRLVVATHHGHIVGSSAVATAGELSLHLWNAITGQFVSDLVSVGPISVEMNTDAFSRHVCFSPDSRRIVAFDNHRAVLYDATIGTKIQTLEECAYVAPNSYAFVGDNVVFSPDSQRLMVTTADPDAPLNIRSAIDGHVISMHMPLNPSQWSRRAAFSPDGSTVAYTGGEKLNWIEVNNGRPAMQSIAIPPCEKLWFSPDGNELHMLSAPDGLSLEHLALDCHSGRLLPTSQPILQGMAPYVPRDIPRRHALAVLSAGGEAGVLDNLSYQPMINLKHCYPGDSCSPFSPDGHEMLNIPFPHDTIEVLNTATWKVSTQIAWPLRESAVGPIGDAIFVGDSRHLLVFKYPEGAIWLFERHRQESPWGVFELTSFWFVVVASILFVGSVRRDRRRNSKGTSLNL